VRELDQKLTSEALNLGENYKKLKSKKKNKLDTDQLRTLHS
jgi:hypothetical protein